MSRWTTAQTSVNVFACRDLKGTLISCTSATCGGALCHTSTRSVNGSKIDANKLLQSRWIGWQDAQVHAVLQLTIVPTPRRHTRDGEELHRMWRLLEVRPTFLLALTSKLRKQHSFQHMQRY